jgi:hypothetical protein
MPMKPDMCCIGRIVTGEIAPLTAEKQSRARRIAITGDRGCKRFLAKQFAQVVAGRGVAARRVAQYHHLYLWLYSQAALDRIEIAVTTGLLKINWSPATSICIA